MQLIPAIDLKDGQCVRLRRGEMADATVFSDDPVATARKFHEAGATRLHIVDLNGAFAGAPVNAGAVTAIAKALPGLTLQIGGGIRTEATIEHYLEAGVSQVIIGTQAVKQPDWTRQVCRQYPGAIIVGLDARAGLVATDGWVGHTTLRAVDLARSFADDGVAAIVYTDIERDGMLQGVNVEATAELAAASPIPVIASGGIATLDDLRALAERARAGANITGAISGRAIYEGTLDLAAGLALLKQMGF